MKTLYAIAALCVLLVMPVSRAADPAPPATDARIDQLEQRINKIDGSLEKILLLLQSQQSTQARPTEPLPNAPSLAPAPAPASSLAPTTEEARLSLAPVSVVTRPRPGVMLDVWLRPSVFRGGVPPAPSLVTIRDTHGPFFHLGRYATEREMTSSIGKPIVQVWRGYLNIKTAGTHVLIAEFRRTTDRQVAKSQTWDDFQFDWSAQLSLNETLLLDEINKFESAGKGTLSRTFSLDLKPGYYAVQLVTWLPKHPADEVYDYKPLTFALRLREPGALKPRDLGASDFFCHE